MRLWETDLPDLLMFDDAFVWILSNCKRSKKAIWAARRSSRQIVCGFWSASSIQSNNAAHHWLNPHCGGRDAVDCDGKSTYPLSSQDAKERPREWPIVNFGEKYNGNLVTLLKTTCNKLVFRLRHCANYWISWKWSRIDIKMYLLVDLFELFGNEMMRLWPAEHQTWILQFFARTRPVNCDSLMELGQISTSTNYSWFPEACLKRRSSVSPCTSECYFWSFRGSGCLLRTILVSILFDNFYNAFFQRRLVHNDGSDSVCQNSFLRCGQVNSVLCILLRSSMNLMIHLPRFLCICFYFCFTGIVVENKLYLSPPLPSPL